MKIAFMGVSSTGKSTLSARVATELGLPHVHEVIPEALQWCRRFAPLTTEDIHEFTPQDEVNFEKGMIRCQVTEEGCRTSGFVADSAQLVQLMYLLYCCVPHMNLAEAEKLYEAGMKHSLTYDVIFYLPQSLPIEDNGFRTTNPLMLKAHDAILRRIMGEARKRGANIHTIAVTDLQQRVDYVKQIVERMPQAQTVITTFTPMNNPPSGSRVTTWPVADANAFQVWQPVPLPCPVPTGSYTAPVLTANHSG